MIALVLLLLAAASGAPPAGPRDMSLDEALQIALQTSETVEIAEADVAGAEGDIWQARSSFLPQLGAQATYVRTFASEFTQIFANLPTGGGGPSIGTELPFGRENAYTFNFNVQQLIYGGGVTWASLRSARLGLESAQIGVDEEKARAALVTAQAYYDAALYAELTDIAQATLEQAQSTLKDVQLGFEVGRNAEFDVLRAQVEVENQRVAVIRQQFVQETAMLRLLQLLQLPSDQALTLTTPLLPDPTAAGVAAESAGVELGEDQPREAVRRVELFQSISEQNVVIQRSQLLPTVSLAGSYGWSHYPDTVIPKTQPELFYNNSNVALTMNIPLFQGGRVRGAMMSARADVEAARANVDLTQELSDVEIQDARTAADLSQAQWEATTTTVGQAQRAYEIAEVRYKEGLSTQTELVDARLALRQAEVNRAQAARDLQLSQIRLALLPALPIGQSFSPFAGGAAVAVSSPNVVTNAAAGGPSVATSGTTAVSGTPVSTAVSAQ